MEREEIADMVASLVMACPNLERLAGFDIPFQHSFDRLSHALSTRKNLRERVWIMGDEDNTVSNRLVGRLDASNPVESFLDLNARHPMLSTLVLHQGAGQSSAPFDYRTIIRATQQLPGLRHLTISGLGATTFPNLALMSLPSTLQSLRLENLTGINDEGLQEFAISGLATSIEKLTLINLEVASLVTLSAILSPRLANLKHFSFVQYQAPSQTTSTPVVDLHCPSLQYLHWEIHSQADLSPTLLLRSMPSTPSTPSFPTSTSEPQCCMATWILAVNIEDGAFPALRRVRVPHDPQGVIQALCRPRATALLPSDASLLQTSSRMRGPGDYFSAIPDCIGTASPTMHSFPTLLPLLSPRIDSAVGTPTSVKTFAWDLMTPTRSRLAAHSRILAARKDSFITFRIFDPEGELQLERSSAGFVGQIGSPITYELKADRNKGSSTTGEDKLDRSEWIAATDELLGQEEAESVDYARRWGACGHFRGEKSWRAMASLDMF